MNPPEQKAALIDRVANVQSIPYVWPGPADSDAVRRTRVGTCASKHALLAEDLAALGLITMPLLVVGPLLPPMLADRAEFAAARSLVEVHECITVLTSWAGPIRVDATWDPPLIARGLPGEIGWHGEDDMPLAIASANAGWSVPRAGLREAKERLRARLYSPDLRQLRDSTLRRLSEIFAEWRSGREFAVP